MTKKEWQEAFGETPDAIKRCVAHALATKEEKNVKNIIYQVCTKLAACAFLAAVVSVGTASYNGLYQPKLPEALQKR